MSKESSNANASGNENFAFFISFLNTLNDDSFDKTIPANIQAQSQAERIKELERENRELKQANEIIKKAAAFFAQAELDRKPK